MKPSLYQIDIFFSLYKQRYKLKKLPVLYERNLLFVQLRQVRICSWSTVSALLIKKNAAKKQGDHPAIPNAAAHLPKTVNGFPSAELFCNYSIAFATCLRPAHLSTCECAPNTELGAPEQPSVPARGSTFAVQIKNHVTIRE